MKKCNKSVVIDACIAKSASEREHPISSNCREFLETIRTSDCKIVFNKELLDEWNKHQSLYTKRWRASMVARKRVQIIKDSRNNELRDTIVLVIQNEKVRIAVMKDVHLVEVASYSDKIIFSKDNTMRRLLGELSSKINCFQEILWLDPSNEKEGIVEWLKEGAKINKEFTLGFLGRGAYIEAAADK
ncbi:hypothetical protein ABEO75_23505 [Paenibacillus macerans]|uniref:hypothetical protein n=1 Tax=Paenibacillus macerans TaxID=44252 RepID=UPI002E2391BF|nr:hypothetical protein [Paenibacillus macerans]